MRLNILNIFRLLAVDIAGQVQVVVILLNFFIRNKPRVFLYVQLLFKGIDNLMNVAAAQAVLISILYIAATGVDHKNAFAHTCVCFVDHHNAGRNACAIKQVCRQADDAFDETFFHQAFADLSLGIAAKQHAVRQDAGAFAFAL